MVRALAFGAGGPRFKSRRGEKFFLLKPELSYFQIRRECARQLLQTCLMASIKLIELGKGMPTFDADVFTINRFKSDHSD